MRIYNYGLVWHDEKYNFALWYEIMMFSHVFFFVPFYPKNLIAIFFIRKFGCFTHCFRFCPFFSGGFPLKNKSGMNEIRAEIMSVLDFQFDQAIRHSLIHAQINIQCVACPKPICCQSKFDACSIQKMGVDFAWMLYVLCVASYIRYFTWFDWNYTEFSFQWLFIFVF